MSKLEEVISDMEGLNSLINICGECIVHDLGIKSYVCY